MSGNDRHEFAPPPRIESHSQLYPPSEFRFADQADPPWDADYEDFELLEPTPIEERPEFTPEDEERAIQAARNDDRIAEHLEGRHEMIGAGQRLARGAKDGDVVPAYDVVFYDYEADLTLRASLDAEFAVESVERTRSQPPLTEAEKERAVAIAREDEWLAGRLHHELVGRVLRAAGEDGHRTADVRFVREDRRVPEYMAIVDLTEDAVRKTGAVGADDVGSGFGLGDGDMLDPILDDALGDLLDRRGFGLGGDGSNGGADDGQ